MKPDKERKVLLTLFVILLIASGAVAAWGMKMNVPGIESPAIDTSDVIIRAVQRGNASAVHRLSCNQSDGHLAVIKSRLPMAADITTSVEKVRLFSTNWEKIDDESIVTVNVVLFLTHEVRGRTSYNTYMELHPGRGYCLQAFYLDKAAWREFHEE